MTQQSLSNSQEASSSASSSGNSASTSATDVYPLPFSFGQKEIVQNSDERRLVTDFIDNNVVAPLAPGANICITDSSDVLVGNPTYFNSDVTIYQYINGNRLPELQNGGVPGQDEVQCNKNVTVINLEKPTTNTRTVTVQHDRCKAWKVPGTSILLLALFIIICFFIFYEPLLTSADIFKEALPNDTTVQEVFISRSMWGGTSTTHVTRDPPASLVIIKHTGGSICFDFRSCSKRVREIQKEQMTSLDKLVDIEYNFLIGGDGRIYVGRDWYVRNEGWPNTVDIAFIGNFTESLPTEKMVSAAQQLIAQGSGRGALDFNQFSVVCHNQTEETDSPGTHLFSEVQNWMYYEPGRLVYVGD